MFKLFQKNNFLDELWKNFQILLSLESDKKPQIHILNTSGLLISTHSKNDFTKNIKDNIESILNDGESSTNTNVEVIEEGKTTTTSSTLYDIIRKFSSGKKINFNLTSENKIQIESEKSVFNLNCMSATEFPLTDENFNENEFTINAKQFLKLLNKCKFSISNDETRHYLSGIYIHQNHIEEKSYLTAAATDSHRMSISKVLLKDKINFEPMIMPKKTIFQICALLENYDGNIKICSQKSKIKILIF